VRSLRLVSLRVPSSDDLADATLVVLAEERGLVRVFTLDREPRRPPATQVVASTRARQELKDPGQRAASTGPHAAIGETSPC